MFYSGKGISTHTPSRYPNTESAPGFQSVKESIYLMIARSHDDKRGDSSQHYIGRPINMYVIARSIEGRPFSVQSTHMHSRCPFTLQTLLFERESALLHFVKPKRQRERERAVTSCSPVFLSNKQYSCSSAAITGSLRHVPFMPRAMARK